MQEKFYKHLSELQSSLKFLLASARTEIYSDPSKTKVCIATNGGVVPGMTAVIKAITKCLEQEYNVKEIYGVKWGFLGLMEEKHDDYITKLTAENMADTHAQGGTILGTSRDEFDLEKVIASLKRHNFTQIYMIGSIETQHNLKELKDEIRKQNLQISVISIPASITNNIPFLDQSFGFNTAVQQSIDFIDSANVEAEAAEYGVGIIRMYGRSEGFIAVQSALASRGANIVVVPEI